MCVCTTNNTYIYVDMYEYLLLFSFFFFLCILIGTLTLAMLPLCGAEPLHEALGSVTHLSAPRVSFSHLADAWRLPQKFAKMFKYTNKWHLCESENADELTPNSYFAHCLRCFTCFIELSAHFQQLCKVILN